MNKSNVLSLEPPADSANPLEEMLRADARQRIEQAVEAELQETWPVMRAGGWPMAGPLWCAMAICRTGHPLVVWGR